MEKLKCFQDERKTCQQDEHMNAEYPGRVKNDGNERQAKVSTELWREYPHL